ncbi:hypothetical protein N7490_000058 [Penicillium lividum]|nr:hypothetical protein N7490_000058 [Penicillium lividum]
MVNQVNDDPKSMKLLVDSGIPTNAYPGFTGDPKLGPFAHFIPDRTEADLGPNRWDNFMGDMLILWMDADYLDMCMSGHVHLLHEQLEKVLEYFGSAN